MSRKQILVGTYNVLADEYTKEGDYRHASVNMDKGGRTEDLVKFIASLGADLIGLQEVEQPLVDALVARGQWQEPFWSQKQGSSDGCLTLVKKHITVSDFSTYHFSDGSGHVVQELLIGKTLVRNTHIMWERRAHQLQELVDRVGEGSALLLGDFNIRPEEPERQLITTKGFKNVWDDEPTAFIANRKGPAALDILAVRGLAATRHVVNLGGDFTLSEIPSKRCPSDHIPVLAQVTLL